MTCSLALSAAVTRFNRPSFCSTWSVGAGFEEPNVQYEGTAELIGQDHEQFQKTDTLFFEKAPHAKKFKSHDTVFIKITPTWIRYSDFTSNQHLVQEIKF